MGFCLTCKAVHFVNPIPKMYTERIRLALWSTCLTREPIHIIMIIKITCGL